MPIAEKDLWDSSQVKNKICIFIKYLVLNGFPIICQNLFRIFPLEVIINSIVLDDEVMIQQYSYYLNLAYQQINKRNFHVDDKKHLLNYYRSYENMVY